MSDTVQTQLSGTTMRDITWQFSFTYKLNKLDFMQFFAFFINFTSLADGEHSYYSNNNIISAPNSPDISVTLRGQRAKMVSTWQLTSLLSKQEATVFFCGETLMLASECQHFDHDTFLSLAFSSIT